jgi:hypothetical protein
MESLTEDYEEIRGLGNSSSSMLCDNRSGKREAKLVEDLVEYVDAFNDNSVDAAECEPWNMSYGPSEWENKKTTKLGGEVKTRVRRWQFNLTN